MPWRIPTFFYIGPGVTVQFPFQWPPGIDMGPQWVMAHPRPFEPDSWLVTERVGKRLICEIGELDSEGGFRCGGATFYEYSAWIRNDGSQGCWYQLEGGRVQ